ncbi:MAG: sensor domain-containing diguanylate cyclase [Clostridiales bacterium]|jgi:diguanylate cyclase (GGDEF)-like protein|nr:sensor domain-containing diguanylate cyclase [Clostridiales bacterium]
MTITRDIVFENYPEILILIDRDYCIVDFNKAARDFFQRQNISLKHSHIDEIFIGREDIKQALEESAELIIDDNIYEVHTDFISASDEKKYMLKAIRDVTEQRKIHDCLFRLATIDDLSGLYNRRHFLKLAQEEFDLSYSNDGRFTILLIDIDYFKTVNDTLGHAAGDIVISEFGKSMRKSFRKDDILGRLGGEEFIVLLKNTDIDKAWKIANDFRKAVSGLNIKYEGNEISLTVSIGLASFSKDVANIHELIVQADKAMYISKVDGGNKTTDYGFLA